MRYNAQRGVNVIDVAFADANMGKTEEHGQNAVFFLTECAYYVFGFEALDILIPALQNKYQSRWSGSHATGPSAFKEKRDEIGKDAKPVVYHQGREFILRNIQPRRKECPAYKDALALLGRGYNGFGIAPILLKNTMAL